MVVAAGLVLLAGTACANPDTDGTENAAGGQPASSSAEAPAPSDDAQPAPPSDQPAGDGAQPAPDGDAAPPAQDGDPKLPPGEGTGEIPVAEDQIDSGALPKSYPKQAAMVERTNQVAVRAQEGGCGKASAELVDENAERVTIKLVETTPRNKMACTMDIRLKTIKVELAEPLGERQLVLQSESRQG